MTIETWLAIAGFVLAALGQFGGLVWWIRGQREEHRLELAQIKQDVFSALAKFKTETAADHDTSKREFGETVQAVRQKINDVELWTRDNLVDKRTFDLVTNRIEQAVSRLSDKIDDRMDKLGDRIEELRP